MKSIIKVSFFLSLLVLGSSFTKAQNTSKPSGGINWVSLADAEKLSKKKKKKVMVDIYTDWCGWCKRLDATTYSDPKVVDYINQNFYAIKLNAESRDSIVYQGVTYKFNGKVNTIANQFMGGSSGYPTLTYLDESLKVVSVEPGYVDAATFLNKLNFYNGNYYLNMTFDKYLKEVANSK
jgi:thioredoxin-related protein